MTETTRCSWSELPADQCDHCGARPGSTIVLAPPEDRPQIPVLPRPSAPLRITIREAEPADPITTLKRDLSEIIELASALPQQAVTDARAKVDGTSLPGGAAMVALGPAADVETFERRIELAEAAWLNRESTLGHVRIVDGIPVATDDRERPDLAGEEDDAHAPPLQLLRYWSNRYRWALDMVWDHIPTIQSEAAFLRHHDVINHITTKDTAAWPHFARDVNRCRTRLEDILTAGDRQTKTRVECDRCGKRQRLILLIGAANDGSGDRWKCPNCKVKMNRDEMLRAHARQLVRAEAAKYVPKTEAVSTLRVHGASERTIRAWFGPARAHVADRCRTCRSEYPPDQHTTCPGDGNPCGGHLTQIWRGVDHDSVLDSWCDIDTHHVWVWWPDLWTRHLELRAQRELSSTTGKDTTRSTPREPIPHQDHKPVA